MTIKIGFIGLGDTFLRNHLKHLINLRKNGDVSFGGAFDPSLSSFNEAKVIYGEMLKSFPSAEALMDSDINALFVSSPKDFYNENFRQAVSRGLHVFLKNPITQTNFDTVEFKRILNIAKEKGLVVSTCYPRRIDYPLVYIKKHLADMKIQFGDLKHFDFSFWHHEVVDSWKKESSLMTSHFCQEMDAYRFVFGSSPVEIRKVSDSYNGYEVNGSSLEDGPSFRFFGSRALKESVYQETIRLDFQKASVFIFLNSGGGIILPEGKPFAVPKMDYNESLLMVNKNFIDSINGKVSNYLTHEDLIFNNALLFNLKEKGVGKYPE